MVVFARNIFLILVIGISAPSFAKSAAKPPLMPAARVTDQTIEAHGGTVSRPQVPTRLGLAMGAMGYSQTTSSPMNFGTTYVGGRFFSRLWLGSRFYFLPSIGYYRVSSNIASTLLAENLLELGGGLQIALFKIGPVGVLAGANQRVGWRFSTNHSGASGTWYYRLGPAAAVNIRLSNSLSLLTGLDATFPLAGTVLPEWSAHTGLLFSL